MDGGAWWAAVLGVAKIQTRLSDLAAAAGRQILLPMGGDKMQWREICSFGGKLRDMFL